MVLGRLRDSDIGNWLRTDDGQAVRLVTIYGPIVLVQTSNGRVYWPIQDIECRISEDEARRILGDANQVQNVPVKKKKLVKPYKRVIRTDPEGIETLFTSIKEAAAQSGVSASSVSKACYEINKKVGGYAFRFEDPEIIKNKVNYDKSRISKESVG